MRTVQLLLVLSLVIASSPALGAAPAKVVEPPVPTPVIETTAGDVQGLVEEGISTFKGIPYAAPPLGALRFRAPQPHAGWDHVLDATDFGAPAMQMYDRVLTGTDLSLQLATVFTMRSDMKIDNEDCLYLNVWTPAVDAAGYARTRPVMVWFHGGGYSYGSGAWPLYDGANLVRKGDVVVVTVNHRLNVFGYLYLAELGGERYARSGNAGMLDLVASLEWIRDNVSRFGGDPNNVTIMGESGGGSKVSTLMAMAAAEGLFHRAVIQSGPGLTAVPAEAATGTAKAILAELGLDEGEVDALEGLATERIMAGVEAAQAKAGGAFGGLRLAPVVDGVVLPRHPFTPDAPAISKDVPVLIGFNKDEWTIFSVNEPWFGTLTAEELPQRARLVVGEKAQALLAAYAELYPDYTPTYVYNALIGDSRMLIGSTTLAERKAAQGGAPIYMYYLTWETPVGGGIFKSPHTLDIPFMFNNVDKAVALTGDGTEARRLEDQMSSAWIAFARTGDPNNETIPHWPAYDGETRATMVFDSKTEIVNDPMAEVRRILASQ
jgi:para-nitrobenzyl esterase